MREHIATLDRHEREMRLHELSVSSDEVAPFPSRDPLSKSHADESRNHLRDLDAHERIKRNYHPVVSELRRLNRVLEEPV